MTESFKNNNNNSVSLQNKKQTKNNGHTEHPVNYRLAHMCSTVGEVYDFYCCFIHLQLFFLFLLVDAQNRIFVN